jgi:glycosyltransferase involved in cell wall biosynthesis
MSRAALPRRLRVLTLVDGIGEYGGGERIAREIAVHLDQDRFDPVLCVTRSIPAEELAAGESALREAGVPLLPLERSTRLDLPAWGRLLSYLRERRVDIVHSHKIGSNMWGAALTRLARTPVFVAHEHTWSFEGNPGRRFLDRELIARRADAFVAVSREDRRRMIEIERIPADKVRFVSNGITALPLPDPADKVRGELAIDPDQPVIGTVAMLRPQKALEVLVEALPSLLAEFPRLQALIIGGEGGGDSYAGHLTELADRLGVGNGLRLLGDRKDVPRLLAGIDVAVLSSDYEGSPLAVMEYMAAAKPVVATRVGGVPDLVQDGVTGLLVERRDPVALADALATLLRDPPRRAAMGRAALERQKAEFSIEGMTGRIEALYEELWQRKGSPRG